jgi:lantibiotic transport system permease protein
MSGFAIAFRAEWLKTKRSLALWLVVVGAFFTPAIIAIVRLVHHEHLAELYRADDFWLSLWKSAWESMAVFFLPMAAILATSLVAQIEYRNNAWKQVHTWPLSRATLFFAKLAVIVVLIALFLVLFDLGIVLSAIVPPLVLASAPYPAAPLPLALFAQQSALYFVDCLPIVAAQYLLGLHFRNFLVPIGVGFLAWVAALAALSSTFGYGIPYAYTIFHYLAGNASARIAAAPMDVHGLAAGYAIAITIVAYGLFATRSQRG